VPDWDPCREWLRFQALRRGAAAGVALALPCEHTPRWDAERGAPYVSGVLGIVADPVSGYVRGEFGLSAFADAGKAAKAQLVEEDVVEEGTCVPFAVLAHPSLDAASVPDRPRLRSRPLAPDLSLSSASLAESLDGARSLGEPATGDDVRVLIPADVLAEYEQLCRAHEGQEVGGLLVGHIRRDVGSRDLFVHVTAQLPARHTAASATRLTFTPDTWNDLRASLALRGQGEIAVGWHHAHPVRRWCAKCPEERQRTCGLRGDFLSEDDRLLHRAIFPRAYGIALVVNDVAFAAPTFSLFGWRRGVLELRGFDVTAARPLSPDSPPLIPVATHA
jgi:proteasome lid subunit RPN8/RPN11